MKQAGTVKLAVVSNATLDRLELLELALAKSDFWHAVSDACRTKKVKPDQLRIVIVPDISGHSAESPQAVDPVLVEALIDQLITHGFSSVSVGQTADRSDRWRHNRDVHSLMTLLGYQYLTPHGYAYDIVDLSEDVVEGLFDPGSCLSGSPIGTIWAEADFRICFGKNKTDAVNSYALCGMTLLGVLPESDKDLHYRHKLNIAEVCVDLLSAYPVHFALIDAVFSNQGAASPYLDSPARTNTVIASPSIILADWAAALKMGEDPFSSPVGARMLNKFVLPRFELHGDVAPFEQWHKSHPAFSAALNGALSSWDVDKVLRPWLQSADPALYPGKDPLTEQAAAVVSKLMEKADHPVFVYGVSMLLLLVSLAGKGQHANRILRDKDVLKRKVRSLNIDYKQYTVKDFKEIVSYLEPLEKVMAQLPPDENGMSLRTYEKSNMFSCSRTAPILYENFVSRVFIQEAIQYMNDYIGGTSVPVRRDRKKRVVCQAERNIYLPQPNYLVLYGGREIDVDKLEFIVYTKDSQKIYWKSVHSENGSAEFDDGTVTFERSGEDTKITLFGRQKFALPPLLQALNLDLYPAIKDPLVQAAYKNYFARTFSNYEAKYEGRDILIGRDWANEIAEAEEPFTDALRSVLDLVAKVDTFAKSRGIDMAHLMDSLFVRYVAKGGVQDESGFVHFASADDQKSVRSVLSEEAGRVLHQGGQDILSIIRELAAAVRADYAS